MNFTIKTATLATLVVLTMSVSAFAAYVDEHFNTDTANLAVDYPDYALTGNGSGSVSGQQLRLNSGGSPALGFTTLSTLPASPDYDIRVQLTSTGGTPGNHNVGLFLGTGTPGSMGANDNLIVFHPGFATGALRVQGTGGFGNTDVGFTPAQGVLHTLAVHRDGAGTFTVTLSDGSNPANSFTTSWSNPSLTTFKVGVATVEALSGTPTGIYDNLFAIPEPSSVLLLGLGGGLLASRCRCRRPN